MKKILAFLFIIIFVSSVSTAEKQKPAKARGSTYKDPITGMEFVFVKGGCYQMGDTFGVVDSDEKPLHEVCVDDFYIGKYEVTQSQWKAIMGNNPSFFKDCGDDCPVERISWDAAQIFIQKLNKKTGKNYRLPTEAEWEYAAKNGGKNEKYAGTSNESELGDYAWYKDNSGGKIHPVGQKKPNGLEIHDMSGNVSEWVNDWYGFYDSETQYDPKGPNSGVCRVLRGGSWDFSARRMRTSDRDYFVHGRRHNIIGFRLAGN